LPFEYDDFNSRFRKINKNNIFTKLNIHRD